MSIARSNVVASSFDFNPQIIQMVKNKVQFGRKPYEDSNAHIANFLKICDTFKTNGIFEDVIHLRLFLFILKKDVNVWLRNLPSILITA